jgi:hypothetical protein
MQPGRPFLSESGRRGSEEASRSRRGSEPGLHTYETFLTETVSRQRGDEPGLQPFPAALSPLIHCSTLASLPHLHLAIVAS